MARTKSTESVLKQLKKDIEQKKVVIGAQRTLKLLRQGKIVRIILAKNCPPLVKEDLTHYTENIGGFELVELDVPNEELGVLCKKPFLISVVGVVK